MSKPKSPKKATRKSFSQSQYNIGVEAEDLVMRLLNQNGHNLIEGLIEGEFQVVKNPNKYAVDLLIMTRNEDKTFKEAFGVEVVRRSGINYPTIFIESNKIKYCNNGLPIFFIVVNFDLSLALVLNVDKDISAYPTQVSNFNENKQKEINVLIPREEFIEWDLLSRP